MVKERAPAGTRPWDEMTTWDAKPPRAAVVGVVMPAAGNAAGGPAPLAARTGQERLDEAVNLTQALNVAVVHAESVALKEVNPSTLLGGGKVAELAEKVASLELEVVVVNAPLSPRQQRQLEVQLKAKVLDRTGLILEIFAARARTSAGKLQVELAQAVYQQSRLVRLWSHLERQRATGKTGGPGERQLELDKRMLKDRIALLRRQLRDVEQTRGLQRMARSRAQLPTVALVGYTNAGKSTLFNRLVDAGTLVADALFATLDPLMRRMELPGGLEVVLVDTVGFIADLPHELVEAFKATLEEVVMADLLLHVQDVSSPERAAQAEDVAEVLREIGAADKRQIIVFNKVDRLEPGAGLPVVPGLSGVGVSAVSGQGVDTLLAAIEKMLKSGWQTLEVQVPASDGRRLAWLYAHGEVEKRTLNDDVWTLVVKLRASDIALWDRLA